MSKLRSRKLAVWVTWAVLTFALVIGGSFLGADVPLEAALTWFGTVSAIYLGAQGATDAVKKRTGARQ